MASHGKLAEGMAHTLDFISGSGICSVNVVTLSAYVDGKPIDSIVKEMVEQVSWPDELIIITDLFNGSVNQKFVSYKSRPHTFLISGMNIALVLSIYLESTDEYLTDEKLNLIIEKSRQDIQLVNACTDTIDKDDE